MTDDPNRPGPPREVHEDAAARERSEGAEERMRGALYELPNEIWDRLAPSQCDAILNTAIRAACEAESQAHTVGKAEGAAEERGRLTHVLQQAWDALSVVGSLELEEAEIYRRVDDAVRSIDLALHDAAIRQRSEAPDDR